MSDLILESGDWRACLRPQHGGLMAALTKRSTPILRSMPAGSVSALDAACFPMVPWCNRIAGAQFACSSQDIALTPNFAPEPHAIHGHGWQSAWEVTRAQSDRCELAYRHAAGAAGWPWAYAATQRIALSPEGCAMALTLTNLADSAMPAGLGFHPYVRRSATSMVRFAAAHIFEVGEDMVPTGGLLDPTSYGDFAASEGVRLPARPIDHCYTGWDGTAHIRDEDGSITLAATDAAHLHLYAPDQPRILCLEPVSHLPDALNRNPSEVPLLLPGECLTIAMAINAELAR